MTCRALIVALVALLLSCSSSSAHQPGGKAVEQTMEALQIPDVAVRDQTGKDIHFYSDLIRGKIVAINFIFTSCPSVCPLLSAKFQSTRKALADRGIRNVQFISITVDPATDTPAALEAYGRKFDAGEDWTFVTGETHEISALLKSLGAAAGAENTHSDFILLGSDAVGRWTRRSSAATPAEITHDIVDLSEEVGNAWNSKADYFTNLSVVDQGGVKRPFYNSYIRDRLVAINFVFTDCKDICPVATENLAHLEKLLGDKAGRDVSLLSISIDPGHDTPQVLSAYRKTHGADWTFLTGKKQNIDWIVYRLGGYAMQPAEHSTVLLLGNDRTGEWRKLFVTEKPAEIARQLDEMNENKPKPQQTGKNGHALFEDAGLSSTRMGMSCANCHGTDGTGSFDAGQRIPNITWDALTRPRPAGQGLNARPAHDATSFARALRFGERPGGGKLSEVMPRFDLNGSDIVALIEYLRAPASGQIPEEGVSSRELHVGAALPLTGGMAPIGARIASTLTRRFEAINAAGGIYGRKITLHVRDVGQDAESHEKALTGLISRDRVLVVAASLGAATDSRIEALAASLRAPVLPAYDVPHGQLSGLAAYVHYILPSLSDEALALTTIALHEGQKKFVLIAGVDQTWHDDVVRRMKAIGAETVETLLPDDADFSIIGGADAVIVLEPPNVTAEVLLRAAEINPRALLLSSAGLAGPIMGYLPQQTYERVRLSVPFESQTIDQDPVAAIARRLVDLIAEALRSSGRTVSRDALERELRRLEKTAPFAARAGIATYDRATWRLQAIADAGSDDTNEGTASPAIRHFPKERVP